MLYLDENFNQFLLQSFLFSKFYSEAIKALIEYKYSLKSPLFLCKVIHVLCPMNIHFFICDLTLNPCFIMLSLK